MKTRNLAIIPARSGSKGLPDKNIRLLAQKPLLAYSIEAAIGSGCFSEIMVSTDSQQYAKIARSFGANVPFLRSQETASDQAGSWDVVREVIAAYSESGKEFDTIMLLQPTSPLRTAADILESYRIFEDTNAMSVIGVTETDHSPLWASTLPDDRSMDSFYSEEYAGLPRQELPVYYRINGAIYLVRTQELYQQPFLRHKSYAYVMPKERSIDIDTLLDFELAELLMKRRIAEEANS